MDNRVLLFEFLLMVYGEHWLVLGIVTMILCIEKIKNREMKRAFWSDTLLLTVTRIIL